MANEKVMAKGAIERIGLKINGGEENVIVKTDDGKFTFDKELMTHTDAFNEVKFILTESEYKVLNSFDEIDAIGHRIVQGGDIYTKSVLVTPEVVDNVNYLAPLAPLHNSAELKGYEACLEVVGPDVPQVFVFDTAFHSTMPPKAYMYALPYEYYEKYRVRRYGAHGTSHQYVSREGAKVAGLDINNSRIITCHIGNGSSVTAIKNGKVVDTSMGFTPLEGMIMGTRCGIIDANIVPYIMKKEGLTPDEMTDILNKKSGFIGLSGKSSDMRDVVGFAEGGDERAQLVVDKLVLDITKLVAAYIAELGGVDLIVFTAGIAENNPWLREDVCKNFEWMGIKIDKEVNDRTRDAAIISAADSTAKVALIPTDEELMIARDTMRLTKDLK